MSTISGGADALGPLTGVPARPLRPIREPLRPAENPSSSQPIDPQATNTIPTPSVTDSVELTGLPPTSAVDPSDSTTDRPVSSSTEPGTPASSVTGTTPSSPNGRELTSEEQEQLQQLQQRDQEVRAHEQAHIAAGGSLIVGGPTYDFQIGPDGRAYAIGGEVQIDTSPVPNDPEATIRKAQQIRRAALAPSDPSSADRAVAAQANQLEAQARAELRAQQEANGDAGGIPEFPGQRAARPEVRSGEPSSANPTEQFNNLIRQAYQSTGGGFAAGSARLNELDELI